MRLVQVIALVVLAAIFITGVVLFVKVDGLVDSMVEKQSVIRQDSEVYGLWVKPTFPTDSDKWGVGVDFRFKIWLFNYTNPVEAQNGSKPIAVPVGPFVYREHREKHNISFSEDGESVSFTYSKTYVFDKELSYPLTEDMNITTINLALAGIIDQSKKFTPDVRDAVDSTLTAIGFDTPEAVQLLQTRKVSEFVYGYFDPVLQALQFLATLLPDAPPIPTAYVSILVDNWNATTLNLSTMDTGKKDVSGVGQYLKWAGYKSLPWWGSPETRTLMGGDGLQFAPNGNSQHKLRAFFDVLTRWITLGFVENATRDGLDVFRYTEVDDFDNTLPINAGFSPPPRNGVINGSADPYPPVCTGPVMVSKPFFLDADPWYAQQLDIPPPNPALHNSVLDIVPALGIPLFGQLRAQINAPYYKVPGIDVTSTFKDYFLPMIWQEEAVEVDPKLLKFIQNKVSQLHSVRTYSKLGSGLLVILAAVGAIWILEVSRANERRTGANQPLLSP